MQVKIKKNPWFRQMPEIAKLCLYSNLILLPGVIILLFYEILGVLLNIPLTYLVMDVLAVAVIRRQQHRRSARQKAEEEEEASGKVILAVRQKIEELRQMER